MNKSILAEYMLKTCITKISECGHISSDDLNHSAHMLHSALTEDEINSHLAEAVRMAKIIDEEFRKGRFTINE